MHSLQGAFSETVYVYAPVWQHVRSQGLPPHYVSMGLGLGYVEVLLARAYHQASVQEQQALRVVSFESDPILRQCFLDDLYDIADPHLGGDDDAVRNDAK